MQAAHEPLINALLHLQQAREAFERLEVAQYLARLDRSLANALCHCLAARAAAGKLVEAAMAEEQEAVKCAST